MIPSSASGRVWDLLLLQLQAPWQPQLSDPSAAYGPLVTLPAAVVEGYRDKVITCDNKIR